MQTGNSILKEKRKSCIENIEKSIGELKITLEENLKLKENNSNISATGMAILHQQYALVVAIENGIAEMKNKFCD